LGLLIVDEEHDASFKQQDGLRYSARDLAIYIGRQRGVPVVLGSATPSLETFYNAESGRYRLARLTRRATGQPPVTQLVDISREKLDEGLSAASIAALRACAERGEQSLVFINRRGFAPALICSSCAWLPGCPRCSARLVTHLKVGELRCHYCGHQADLPRACPECGDQDLRPVGHGTQRIEDVLQRVLPGARVLRVDRDSTRNKDAWRTMRADITATRVDVLVGTQMLAKGHDFPAITLVVVINADAALFSTDFRGAERLYATLTQVSGRAGRARAEGRVLVQTAFPHHPLYQALIRDDFAAFAHTLLAERRVAAFPPYMHQALLRAEAVKESNVMAFLQGALELARPAPPQISVYDPVPATVARVAGHSRAHVLIQSRSRRALQTFLHGWVEQISAPRHSSVRWSIDVDPAQV
jgi:primosomal protein N' (replication factor Y)